MYTELFPGSPYEYFFLDKFFDRQYKADRQFNTLFGLFSGLAILISCLGLYGLAMYTASQRTQEIGIRKVLGASVTNLLFLLSRDYLHLVLIALVIAIPIANYVIEEWLQNFAYAVPLQWWQWVLPASILILSPLLIISTQTLRAARRNPVDSLRDE